jgi:non-ribosomal peptide synthetase component F
LLTTFATLLHHYTGQRDLAVATLAPSGRKRPEVQRLLGYFLNPVVLRVDFTGDPPFSEMLTRTQRIIANALCHDDLPLAAIRQDSTVDSMCGALAPIALSLQPQTPPLDTDWEVTSMDANSGGSIWELYLAFIQRGAGLIGRAQYNPDVFDTSTVAKILTDLETLLQGATANPAQRISTLLSRMRQMTT